MLTQANRPRRTMGWMTGTKIPDDFDTMGANEIADMFESSGN